MVYPNALKNFLSGYKYEYEFEIDRGKEDKIEIHSRGLFISGGHGADDTINRIIDDIISYETISTDAREGTDDNESGSGVFFLRPQGTISSKRIRIRSHRERLSFRPDRPLFAGNLVFKRQSLNDNFRDTVWRIELNLSFNPTRFLHHRASRELYFAARENGEISLGDADLLSRRLQRTSGLGERILDLNDNCLISWRSMKYSGPSVYRIIRNSYIEKCYEFIILRLSNIAQQNGAQFGGQVTHNLKHVETYWEVGSDTPQEDVWRSFKPLISFGRFHGIGYPKPCSSSRRRGLRRAILTVLSSLS